MGALGRPCRKRSAVRSSAHESKHLPTMEADLRPGQQEPGYLSCLLKCATDHRHSCSPLDPEELSPPLPFWGREGAREPEDLATKRKREAKVGKGKPKRRKWPTSRLASKAIVPTTEGKELQAGVGSKV